MPINIPQVQAKKSSGLFGEIAGTVGGLAQAAGAIASLVPGGQAIGQGLSSGGGAIQSVGALADPAKTTKGSAISPLSTMENSPGVQAARLADMQSAIKSSPLIPQQEFSRISPYIDQAKKTLLERMGRA